MTTTLKDIAAVAGVSYHSVAKVINDRPSYVSKATRDKILKIARDLNYRPNYLASSLKKGRTDTIGFLGEEPSLDNQFAVSNNMAVAGIQKALPEDKALIIFANPGNEGIDKSLALAGKGIVDGLIIKTYIYHFSFLKNKILPALDRMNLPYVVMHPSTTDLSCAHVGADPVKAGFLIGRHLLDKGITDVAVFSVYKQDPEYLVVRDGVAKAFTAQGLEFGPDRTLMPDTPKTVGEDHEAYLYRCFEEMEDLPRALVCISSYTADIACRVFTARGLRVPEDIIIAGFGSPAPDSPVFKNILMAGVPLPEHGRAAAEMLLDMLGKKDGKSTGRPNLLLEPQIL